MPKIQINNGEIPSPQGQNEKKKNLFVQVPLEVLEAGISTSAMKLYLILLKYARQSNECWPSQQTLGCDMTLKPRRIADLLKELESASLISIVCRAKEGLPNLYHLLKVVQAKEGSSSSSSKTADGTAKKDRPGKQKNAEEGMQNIADESHAVEINALNTHTHTQFQAPGVKENLGFSKVGFNREWIVGNDVCASRNFEEREPSAVGRVTTVLSDFGVSEVRARQLATTVIRANLNEDYVKSLIEWIGNQTSSRTIYNPAGLLVQMVHQLSPVPIPKGKGVPTLNGLQLEVEQKRKFIEVQLPQLISIEERNLVEARSERDKQRIQARLDMLLAHQAKEGGNLIKGSVIWPTVE